MYFNSVFCYGRQLVLTVLVATNIPVWSQVSIMTDNLVKDSTETIFQMIPYTYYGDDGENQVWDISQSGVCGRDHIVKCLVVDSELIRYTDPQRVTYCTLTDERIEQCAVESRLAITGYSANKRKLFMKFPLEYGDSVSAPFDGYGLYCGNHNTRECGQVVLRADATGTLILSPNDTIRNVLRVYTLTTSSLAMDVDVSRLDTTKLKQEVEERYDWYAKGRVLPLYTTIVRTSFTNLQPIATTASAYKVSQESYNSTEYAEKRDSFPDAVISETNANDSFHYNLTQCDGSIQVNCSSEEDATLTALLVSSMGVTYRSARETIRVGEDSSFSFNYLGLPHGHYIVYMNVNGRIYSHTVSLQ